MSVKMKKQKAKFSLKFTTSIQNHKHIVFISKQNHREQNIQLK